MQNNTVEGPFPPLGGMPVGQGGKGMPEGQGGKGMPEGQGGVKRIRL